MHAEIIFDATKIFELVLKKIEAMFCVFAFFFFFFVKLKVAFKKTKFWWWIWALNNTNQFHNLELIEFKAWSAPKCISIPLSNLGMFFQKMSITYNLGQNCCDKIKNLFFSGKTLSLIWNFGRGRWLGLNHHLFKKWLKEKRHYFCKDYSCGHDLHINRMWKWLFWRGNSEKLKSFGRGRSVEQNDAYFRSYMTQRALIILCELAL